MKKNCFIRLFVSVLVWVSASVFAGSSAELTKIDKNFEVATVNGLNVEYHDVTDGSVSLEGLPWWEKGQSFHRLPYSMTKNEISEGAISLSVHTPGVAARFCTDSPYITIRASLLFAFDMANMPRTGGCGFDLFIRKDGKLTYLGNCSPDMKRESIEQVLTRSVPAGMNEYCLNFPLYGGATKVEIGIAPGSRLEMAPAHAVSAPVVFYGSSITQGGCASRPGNCYSSWLCRAVDAEQVNLGLCGSGLGEPALAREIATLKMSCFVLDYDYNAPTAKYLKRTHEQFYKIIREAQPELPIIMMSRPNFRPDTDNAERRDIVKQTYLNAKAAGDDKVWFIDGEFLFGTEDTDGCTVDGCHPNDIGFYRMYQTILPVLKEALNIQ